MSTRDPVVSFDNEQLILVDQSDAIVGYDSKEACHQGAGKLHRAFSVFLFNAEGELLLHQRSEDKPLWPLYWTNSCCSHPRRGEELMAAANRRVREELGINAELTYTFRFQYQAPFGDRGSEHELCSVLVGRVDEEPNPNRNEIQAWRYMAPAELTAELERDPDHYTPWLKIEWPRLLVEHGDKIGSLWP